MAAKKSSAPVRNVASFKANHDPDTVIPNKIRAALAKMEADHGPEHYEYDGDFVRLAGVGLSALALHRDTFKDHIVEAKPVGLGNARSVKRAWFATTKAAKAARGA